MRKREVSTISLARELGSIESDADLGSTSDLVPDSTWASAKRYLYNPSNGTCCQRTPRQWLIMVLYYLGYTAFLVLLYCAFLYGFTCTIHYLSPTNAIMDKELLLADAYPGLGFVPNIELTKFPIIWYTSVPSEEKTEEGYVEAINNFFTKYKNANRDDYIDCSTEKNENKPCYFDLSNLGDCSTAGYQYTNSSLCFFLKLNKRKNWKPTYFRSEQDFPDEMSQSMMDHILASSDKDIAYVECLGENAWDNEHLGEMTYYPRQGFNGYHFPYKGESEYLPPLVAVKMSGVTTGVVIHIKCTVWAKNIGPKLNNVYLKVFIDNTLFY